MIYELYKKYLKNSSEKITSKSAFSVQNTVYKKIIEKWFDLKSTRC